MDSPKLQAMRQAHALIATGGTAAMSVLDVADGGPFTTLVNVAADEELSPLILISSLSHHSKCLAQDARCSLLLHEPIAETTDPMLTFRVTLVGQFIKLNAAQSEAAFLSHHPYADLYVGFGDFDIWRMTVDHAHIIAGFGRAYGVRYKDIVAL
jgi:heme iron utilization protein